MIKQCLAEKPEAFWLLQLDLKPRVERLEIPENSGT